MGYTSSGGTKGRGTFNNTPGTTSDFNQLLALLNAYGNYLGGVSEATRDAVTGDALYEGLLLWNTDAEAFEFYDGSGWERAVPFVQSGSVVTTSEPTTSRQTLTFTFPIAFAAAPILIVSSYISSAGSVVNANQSISSTTATDGAIFYTATTNFSSGNHATFSWLAIGVKG